MVVAIGRGGHSDSYKHCRSVSWSVDCKIRANAGGGSQSSGEGDLVSYFIFLDSLTSEYLEITPLVEPPGTSKSHPFVCGAVAEQSTARAPRALSTMHEPCHTHTIDANHKIARTVTRGL